MKNLLVLFILATFYAVSGIAQVPAGSTEQAESSRAEKNNLLCYLNFTDAGLVSAQDINKDYLIYEVPEMSASDLKASTLTTISSMYSSPKDIVTSLSDNMIQLEGYIASAYLSMTSKDLYPVDVSFTWTMQFKDGKIRINIPRIKQIYVTGVPLMGTLTLDMKKPLPVLINKETDRDMVAYKLNKLITAICKNAKSANNW